MSVDTAFARLRDANPVPDPARLTDDSQNLSALLAATRQGSTEMDTEIERDEIQKTPTPMWRKVMTGLVAAAVVILVGAAILLLTRDTEPDVAGTPQSTSGVTLTSEACIYSGPESVTAGPVSIAVVNETSHPAVFDFHRISDTHTYADLASHIDEEQARLDAGDDVLGPPPYTTITDQVTFVDTSYAEAAAEAHGLTVFHVGEEGSLDTTLTAGIYAVVCEEFLAFDSSGLDSLRITGPFEATA